ncbi:MAG: DUF402 domain-containing protein [Pyrinomonadaceae bacterium]
MTPNQKITIISQRFDLKFLKKWDCNLLLIKPPQLLCYGIFSTAVLHKQLGEISRGTVSLESFWTDRYYNLFAFFDPDFKFRNLYFNICLPPVIQGDSIVYSDLDIDVAVWPDGSIDVLDEDDFASNALTLKYPEQLKSKVRETLSEILELAENHSPYEIFNSVFGECRLYNPLLAGFKFEFK